MARKDLLSRLADAGEEAIGRLADAPGADRLAGVATSLRDRVDELQKKVRGIETLEVRIAELERRVEALERRPAAARKPAARAKPKASTTRSASTKKT
jgi:outer membrane murein-binding lipoprotein Lpp